MMHAMPLWIIPSYELCVVVQIVIYMYHAEVRDGPSDHNRRAKNKQAPEFALLVKKYLISIKAESAKEYFQTF